MNNNDYNKPHGYCNMDCDDEHDTLERCNDIISDMDEEYNDNFFIK